jgi:hypothetical protein
LGDVANISKAHATILLAEIRHQTPLFPIVAFGKINLYIHKKDGGSMNLQNVGNIAHICMV